MSRAKRRRCPSCGEPLSTLARSDAVYCGSACKQAAYRKRLRGEA
ncbi:hypothetical protein ACFCZ3_19985 [Cellulosimicrobium cellulans]